MKKLILLFIIASISMLSYGQDYKKFWGGTGDTIVASVSKAKTYNARSKYGKSITVSFQLDVDSVSGTPSGTATLYESVDGHNFITTGESVTWSTGVDTSFVITDTTFRGAYAKIDIVPTATTQKSNVNGAMLTTER
jgi:hypothetical protein